MNRIEKEGIYENIYFQGHIARSVKRGDVILRPILADILLDRFINWVMPGNFEHAMLYLGDGMLLNPYPDRKGSIHKEHLFDNFSWRTVFTRRPRLLTFARITDDSSIIENTISRLEHLFDSHSTEGYCSSTIISAFVQAGIPRDTFIADHLHAGPLSTLVVNTFDTGYEIAKGAQQLIRFERLLDRSN